MRNLISAIVAIGLVFIGSQVAAEPIRSSEELVMITGESYQLHDCAKTNRPAELFYRIDRAWLRLARSTVSMDRATCKDRMLPYKHTFNFKVPAVYKSIEPEAKYQKILLRTTGPGRMPTLFTATVFKSKAEKDKALGINNTINQQTDWSKCLFNGVTMMGRVKVVTYDADFRVQLVNKEANLIVEQATGRATGCGSWQFVNQNANFSIQFVNENPDFTILMVKTKGPKR